MTAVLDNRRATVSLVMIVRNEAHQLAECLAPVAGLFDQIVVVDTGSTDATKAVASQFASLVVDFFWCDDFAAARNECLVHATGDWVFWLDADDRMSSENIVKLERLLRELDQGRRCYLMDTVCWSEFVSDGSTLISHPRLFRRVQNLHWHGRVHEQLRLPPGDLALDAHRCDVRIDHLGYQDRAMQQRKLQRNVRLLRMDYALDPDDESTLLHLGMSYLHLGRLNDAREYLQKLTDAPTATGDHLRQVFASLALITIKQGNVPGALRLLEQGTVKFPGDHYLQYLYAECFYEIDQFAAARTILQNIIASEDRCSYHGGVPGDVRQHLAPRRLADVLRLEGDYSRAEALCRSLLVHYPQDTHIWHTLGRVFLDGGRHAELLNVVERIRDCPEGPVFAALLLALWHMTHREWPAAAQQIDWLIAQAPRMPLPRLLRVELLNQTGAALEERKKACRDALRLHPGNQDVLRVLESLEAAPTAVARQGQWPTLVLGAGVPAGATLLQ